MFVFLKLWRSDEASGQIKAGYSSTEAATTLTQGNASRATGQRALKKHRTAAVGAAVELRSLNPRRCRDAFPHPQVLQQPLGMTADGINRVRSELQSQRCCARCQRLLDRSACL